MAGDMAPVDGLASSRPAAAAAAAASLDDRSTVGEGAILNAAEPIKPIAHNIEIRAEERAAPRARGYMHFVAGGIGGMCGAIVTSPLDVVKTRLQSDMYAVKRPAAAAYPTSPALQKSSLRKGGPVQPVHRSMVTHLKRLAYHFVETGQLLRDIATNEGPRALFRGLGPTLVGVIPARSINFYTYGNGKSLIAEHFNNGLESPVVHLTAAAGAGIVTATATNPIWVVKTRLQLNQHEMEKVLAATRHGRALGNSQHTGLASAAFTGKVAPFSTHAIRATALAPLPSGKVPVSLVSRSIAHAAASSPTRPDTNSVRMALHILRTEGVMGMYKGMSASYLGVAEGTIQWALYEELKGIASRRTAKAVQSGHRPGAAQKWLDTIGAAGTAKMVASLITYPHEVLRTRLRQEAPAGQIRKYTGLLQTTKVVLREEGIAAFYGGLSAHLLRVVPNAAIMFVVYETMLTLGRADG